MAASDSRGRPRNAPVRGAKGAARGGRGRGKKRGGGAALPSVANHPRAGDQVKRAKGWAGLAGFALVAFVSWRGEVPVEDMLLRALAGGIVAYLVVWATAVAIWRHLVVTELEVVREQREEEEAARRAAVPPPVPEQPAEV
ncbi:hypothetical protein [Conexibacter sp. CPCC 206217]|uniref:hypothetical protein n=1 Tax=Conexibacter sp. CPCC 206217 TaxID=3064574 RepID=UPI002727B5F6|nr:hypothetical protein [Conexibacter sp. CPCC 206217]MDO8211388.1 hypothetical protein [Conexibacter sp. CPCC 206217]